MPVLVHKPTGRVIVKGETLPDFRGDLVTVRDWYSRPAPSTGRVVTDRGEFYPSVIDCEIRDGEQS